MTETQRALAIHLVAWAIARAALEELSRMEQVPDELRALALIYRGIFLGEPLALESADDTTNRVAHMTLEKAAARFQSLFGAQVEEHTKEPPPLALMRVRMRAHLESWQRVGSVVVKLLRAAGPEGRAIALLVFRIVVLGETLDAVAQSVREPDVSLLVAVLDQELLGTL